MECINQTVVKRLHPKKGYTAPYIQFPWGYDRALIGKPVTIFKTDDGFFLSLSLNEFESSKEKNTLHNETCFANDQFKPKQSLKSRKINLKSQISARNSEIENSRVQSNIDNQIVQNKTQTREVSGRSKPPFVVSGIQLCVIPGQVPGDPMVLF